MYTVCRSLVHLSFVNVLWHLFASAFGLVGWTTAPIQLRQVQDGRVSSRTYTIRNGNIVTKTLNRVCLLGNNRPPCRIIEYGKFKSSVTKTYWMSDRHDVCTKTFLCNIMLLIKKRIFDVRLPAPKGRWRWSPRSSWSRQRPGCGPFRPPERGGGLVK